MGNGGKEGRVWEGRRDYEGEEEERGIGGRVRKSKGRRGKTGVKRILERKRKERED